MKQILIFLGIVLLCWSCEEDKLDLYKGSDSIYFCYPKVTSGVSNVYMDTTVFSFASIMCRIRLLDCLSGL